MNESLLEVRTLRIKAPAASPALMALMALWVGLVAPATAQTDALHVTTAGNVGIGTASPGRELHIRRTDATSTGFVVENANASAQNVLFDMTTSDQSWRFRAHRGGDFQIIDNTASIARLNIDSATGQFDITGSLVISGSCTAGGGPECDLVFQPDYALESLEEHAAFMWENSYLPGVGPTPEDSRWDLGRKSAGILNELEKAHIYIEQLNQRLTAKDVENDQLRDRLARIERHLGLDFLGENEEGTPHNNPFD